MSYTAKQQTPSVREYIDTRLAAGLPRISEQAAATDLRNGLFAVMVFQGDTPVAIGRIIGDGDCFFQVTDMAVLPEHQGNGVGTMVMDALVDWLQVNAPSTAYISLMADHGTPEFYARFGFIKAELPNACGMYMRIK